MRLRAVLSCEKCSENVRGSPAPGGFVCSPGESRPGLNDTTSHAPSTGEALPCCPKALLEHHTVVPPAGLTGSARAEGVARSGSSEAAGGSRKRTLPRRLPRAAQAGAHVLGPAGRPPGWLLFSPTSSLPAAAERWPGTQAWDRQTPGSCGLARPGTLQVPRLSWALPGFLVENGANITRLPCGAGAKGKTSPFPNRTAVLNLTALHVGTTHNESLSQATSPGEKSTSLLHLVHS